MALVSTLPRLVDAVHDISPARTVGNLEPMFTAFAENLSGLSVKWRPGFFLLGDGVIRLTLPLIAEAFVEHQGQDVILVILAGGFAAQDLAAPQRWASSCCWVSLGMERI